MNNIDQFIEVIKKSYDRECTDDPQLKYLIELPMTKEEYDVFIKIINNK
jgi:hypothetical protein